jgi:hypothetical protein
VRLFKDFKLMECAGRVSVTVDREHGEQILRDLKGPAEIEVDVISGIAGRGIVKAFRLEQALMMPRGHYQMTFVKVKP